MCGGSKGVFWGEKMLENKTARQREYVATRADERERERQRVGGCERERTKGKEGEEERQIKGD